jgi:hypothetical protein
MQCLETSTTSPVCGHMGNSRNTRSLSTSCTCSDAHVCARCCMMQCPTTAAAPAQPTRPPILLSSDEESYLSMQSVNSVRTLLPGATSAAESPAKCCTQGASHRQFVCSNLHSGMQKRNEKTSTECCKYNCHVRICEGCAGRKKNIPHALPIPPEETTTQAATLKGTSCCSVFTNQSWHAGNHAIDLQF